jgi:hypothetical protein
VSPAREEIGAPQFMRTEPCIQCGSTDFAVKLAPQIVVDDIRGKLSETTQATIDWTQTALRTCRKCGTHGVALALLPKEPEKEGKAT